MKTSTMTGRIAIITGANSGVGKATATELARLDATVILVCRDAKRGEMARAEIVQQTGNPKVEVMLADLSSQASVRKLATEFTAKYPQLHVLVNNAAAVNSQRQLSADGIERTFAANYLGPFLLTNLLLPVMTASDAARIVNVAARTYRGVQLDFDNLQGEKIYRGPQAYLYSKLANVMVTYELARRLKATNVTVNAVHPGVIHTNLARDFNPLMRRVINTLTRFFAKSAEQGAETVVYLASAPEVAGISGQYFINKKAVRSSPQSYERQVAARLWETSQLLINKEPEKT